jgi:hypothetical protein
MKGNPRMARIARPAFPATTPVAAMAGEAAAAACKRALSPLGQEICTTTLAQSPAPATARGIIPKEVEKLVAEGKTTISEGRTAAEAAGKHLELRK